VKWLQVKIEGHTSQH